MAEVMITHMERGPKWMQLKMPYLVMVDGRAVGVMQTRQARMTLPAGQHQLTIRAGGYLPLPFTKKKLDLTVEASETFEAREEEKTELTFEDREKWWNILFDADLVLWITRLFVTFPEPWGLVYDIVSNVSFGVWVMHFWVYRKRFYRIYNDK